MAEEVTLAAATGSTSGSIAPYVPACGNVHFPPNGRAHYDDHNYASVSSTCKGFGLGQGSGGQDKQTAINAGEWGPYTNLAPDCMGRYLVWWWQNIPGYRNPARDSAGQPMLNWWVFLYY